HDAVEAVSLYWHFVDVVWIVLFSTLYLLPGHTAACRPGGRTDASPPSPAERRPRRDRLRRHRRDLLVRPVLRQRPRRLRRVDDADRPRDRDGGHGVRPRRRLAPRVGGRDREGPRRDDGGRRSAPRAALERAARPRRPDRDARLGEPR